MSFLLTGALITANVAFADHGDAKPACADFRNFDVGYTNNTVTAIPITTSEPSCKNITYSLVVVVDENTTPLTFSRAGTGSTEPFGITSTPIVDDDPNVCVSVTASRGGKEGLNKQLDALPDTGCVVLTEEGGSGTIGHG